MPGCPALGQGRGRWFAERFQEHFGTPVSAKTVRLWGQGHRPASGARLLQIATVLRVDAAWLYFGDEQRSDPRLNGILSIVAGLIQLDGGAVSIPTADCSEAGEVNLLATIKGASHAFHVIMGQRVRPGAFRFTVSEKHGRAIVLGVLRDGLTFRLVKIPRDRIERGREEQGSPTDVELSAGDVVALKVENFSRPLVGPADL